MNQLSGLCERSAKLIPGPDNDIIAKARELGWSADEIASLHLVYGPSVALDFEQAGSETANSGPREIGK